MEVYTITPSDPKSTRAVTPKETAYNALLKERHCLNLLDQYLRSGDIFLDIGAHAGYYSLYARNIVGSSGQVHCFDPNRLVYPVLINNLATYFSDTVIALEKPMFPKLFSVWIYSMAVSSHNRKQLFREDFYSEASKLLPDGSEPASKYEYFVNTITIDSFFNKANFIKIDVEGEELNVLKGAAILLKHSLPHLLIEVHHDQGVEVSDIISFLNPFGYISRDAKNLTMPITSGNIYKRTKHIFATITPMEG